MFMFPKGGAKLRQMKKEQTFASKKENASFLSTLFSEGNEVMGQTLTSLSKAVQLTLSGPLNKKRANKKTTLRADQASRSRDHSAGK